MLQAAGFDHVELTPVDEPFWMGSDAENAFAFFRGGGVVRGMTQDLDDAQRAKALDALRSTIVEHDTGDGVLFGSGAWLITARRRAG